MLVMTRQIAPMILLLDSSRFVQLKNSIIMIEKRCGITFEGFLISFCSFFFL